jgi:hypothetical protein
MLPANARPYRSGLRERNVVCRAAHLQAAAQPARSLILMPASPGKSISRLKSLHIGPASLRLRSLSALLCIYR